MKHKKLVSAVLSGAMMVSMIPQVLSADTTDELGSDQEDIVFSDHNTESDITIDSTSFPDPEFNAYVRENYDTDSDGILSASEIGSVKEIDVHGRGIASLEGIRSFTSLEKLVCATNELTTLDLSGMTTLELVNCTSNSISSLDVSGLSNLTMLMADRNELREIDVRECDNLQYLTVSYNHISELLLSHMDELLLLSCSHNEMETLYVSGAKVSQISCENNNLTGIDVSFVPNLSCLWCFANEIDALDLRNTPKLAENIRNSEQERSSVESDPVDIYSQPTENEHVYFYCLMVTPGTILYMPESTEPTTTTTPAPAVEIPDEPGVSGFVERLYCVALGRRSDAEGKQNWIDAITSGANTGADAARGFLLSPEFLNKDMSTSEFVDILYRTFFGREPDQNGHDAWVAAINNGASKEEVINGFINSTEWANLCVSYGISSGGTGVPNIEVEPNSATIEFATRLYTTCLGRDADEPGMLAWARQLANQRDTGTGAARGFFFSEEFTRQNVSNEEYVNRLYRTFMGREADEAGFSAWVAQLNAGTSREEVFNGFAQSVEFTRICASYGIIKGS
ncbi:MAG: DUF4214 domain-containing protein [Clostridiales bacterium]|nr:DUF4214 domain-containing protein [Clostridiales bacterium]